MKRLEGYRKRIVHEYRMLLQKYRLAKEQKAYFSWINQLESNPPEVLLGPNFSTFGGVKHHIEAITKYSQLKTELAPSATVRRFLEPYHLTEVFASHFSKFVPRGIKIVHSHVFPWFMNWCNHCEQHGLKWIHTYHLNYFPEHAEGPLSDWQNQVNEAATTIARNATQRICVSKWQVEYFRTNFDIDSLYIPNGVDVLLSEKAKPSRFRTMVPNRDFVLYVGRDDPVKNPKEFIKLAQANPTRSFVMVGAGLSPDTISEKYKLTVPTNLTVLGSLTQQQSQDAIAATAAVVVTSHREGLPTLVLEALAANKPIVVPNEAGCMEAIGDGEAGFIYQLGDIDDLSRKLDRALKSSEVAERGRPRVLREYDWRIAARLLDQLYSSYTH
jgi:glycosyltransferase involved in cell wall biosynthesis